MATILSAGASVEELKRKAEDARKTARAKWAEYSAARKVLRVEGKTLRNLVDVAVHNGQTVTVLAAVKQAMGLGTDATVKAAIEKAEAARAAAKKATKKAAKR